ncbi:MAG: NADH-quinone oxidoreductase subunit, partial [Acidobacteriota bacterium]|nr:NADH-quinone oxidoreductase subunit [Acidobacteriota bacterium]
PKNETLNDLKGREWAYMIPLLVMSLWIGVYPKPFLDFIQKPVAAIVRHVRPDYPFPAASPRAPQTAENQR